MREVNTSLTTSALEFLIKISVIQRTHFSQLKKLLGHKKFSDNFKIDLVLGLEKCEHSQGMIFVVRLGTVIFPASSALRNSEAKSTTTAIYYNPECLQLCK
jgi:hypothetical protein